MVRLKFRTAERRPFFSCKALQDFHVKNVLVRAPEEEFKTIPEPLQFTSPDTYLTRHKNKGPKDGSIMST